MVVAVARWNMAAPFNTSPISGVSVLIISSDDETLDGTYEYLNRVGATPKSATQLPDAISAAKSTQAVIFFADDYAKDSAIETLAELRKQLHAKVIIVVSDQVEAFTSVEPDEADGPVTVLRRPTWGWMLLDAIRARLGAESAMQR